MDVAEEAARNDRQAGGERSRRNGGYRNRAIHLGTEGIVQPIVVRVSTWREVISGQVLRAVARRSWMGVYAVSPRSLGTIERLVGTVYEFLRWGIAAV